jgi:hypothetical protein
VFLYMEILNTCTHHIHNCMAHNKKRTLSLIPNMLAMIRQCIKNLFKLPTASQNPLPHANRPTGAVSDVVLGYDVIDPTDVEPTTTECAQVVVHKCWCHTFWYAKQFVRGVLYVIEHIPEVPQLHAFED